MELSFIIPTCNRNHILLTTLDTILNTADKFTTNYEIIVVNDGEHEINFNHNKVTIYKHKNKGVAGARNLGASHTTFENLVFIDDDILVTDDAFERICDFFNNENKNRVLNISWAFPPELKIKLRRSSFGRFLIAIQYTEMKGWMAKGEWKEDKEYPVENLASYCLAIIKSTFERTGGYNEVFPFAGFEDYDFSQRAKKAGITPILNTHIKVWHNESDRIAPAEWFKRRYREGYTRAVYVNEMKDRSYIINPGWIKKILFAILKPTTPFTVFVLSFANRILFLDRLTHPVFKAITGAQLYAGYKDYAKKS